MLAEHVEIIFSILSVRTPVVSLVGRLEPLIDPNYTGSNLVFIVGCPRSGTTWLQQLLASYPKAKTGRETHLFSWLIGPQLRAWRKEMDRLPERGEHIGIGPPAYFTESEFLRNLKTYLLVLLDTIVGNLGPDEFFIEKTPNHALFIPEIVQMLPDCKIIHVLRDARDTVASLLEVNKSSHKIGGGESLPWAPESARGAARLWVEHVRAARAAAKNLPSNQFYEVRYRDLKASPETELMKLSQFLSWKWDRESIIGAVRMNDPAVARKAGSATAIPVRGEFQRISSITLSGTHTFARKAKVGSWKEELSLKQKIGVWLVARKTMNEVGYHWKYPW